MNKYENTKMQKCTLETFGTELGAKLLEQGLIVPIGREKMPMGKWKQPDGQYRYNYDTCRSSHFNAPSFAVILGGTSGLMCYDYDDNELLAETGIEPNVKSARGGHIYVQHSPDVKSTIGYNELKLDILSDKHYAIFCAPGKTVVHSTIRLVPPSLQEPVLRRDDKNRLYEGKIRNEDKKSVANSYEEQVKGTTLGMFQLRLEKDRIMQGLVTQMKDSTEGSRNFKLYRFAVEAYRLCEDTRVLADAANLAGLGWEEIGNTLGSAEVAIDDGDSVSVLDRVLLWHEQASQFGKSEKQQTIIDYVASNAVALNTYLPQVNQLELSKLTGINRGYINAALNTSLCKKYGMLECLKPKGKQPDGKDWPNNYYLCLSGVRLEDDEMRKTIDSILLQ